MNLDTFVKRGNGWGRRRNPLAKIAQAENFLHILFGKSIHFSQIFFFILEMESFKILHGLEYGPKIEERYIYITFPFFSL
jgi:hypothetical protein